MAPHASSTSDTKHCPSCNAVLQGPYCHVCGERKHTPRNYSILKFAEESLDILTHYDSKLYNTLRQLISKPGLLTTEYLKGRHVPYVRPVQLFVIINVLYFLIVSVFGWDTFATHLEIQRTNGYYGSLVQSMVDSHLAGRALSLEQYRSTFDHASAATSKTLIFIMIPFLALVLQALYRRPKHYYLENLIFSIHFFSFLLLYLIGAGILVKLALLMISGLSHHDVTGYNDFVATIVIGAATVLYFYFALRRARAQTRLVTAAKAIVLTYVAFWVLWIYRFILFLVCIIFF
jgi:hypothetical protein